MAKITIGGREFTSQPLKFKQLKKAYPLIQSYQKVFKDAAAQTKETGEVAEIQPITTMEMAIGIVAIALEKTNPELTIEKIEEEISLDECRAFQDAIIEIITESGFEAAKPGEGVAAEGAASPSTETLTA